MQTATSIASEDRHRELDERTLHNRVKWFVEKWTTQMDLNKRDAAELNADLIMVVQSVHADASREYHALLKAAFAVMPPAQFIVKKPE